MELILLSLKKEQLFDLDSFSYLLSTQYYKAVVLNVYKQKNPLSGKLQKITQQCGRLFYKHKSPREGAI